MTAGLYRSLAAYRAALRRFPDSPNAELVVGLAAHGVETDLGVRSLETRRRTCYRLPLLQL
jgi:hypothetical protein